MYCIVSPAMGMRNLVAGDGQSLVAGDPGLILVHPERSSESWIFGERVDVSRIGKKEDNISLSQGR